MGDDGPPPVDRELRDAAEAAELRYVTDDEPGLFRHRRGRGWSFHRPDGSLIEDAEERERIAALAIPPAWSDVWICPHPDGHLQATGRDDRGRKQYRYHPAWNEAREEMKFARLAAFGRSLPGIRRGVAEALKHEGLGREKVLAAVVLLLERTGIRVGNDEYARENETYGLTTIRRRHVEVEGSRIHFRFEAKGGRDAEVVVQDARLAEIVGACRDARGWEVFKWFGEDGEPRDVKSRDVNRFLQELAGEEVTAKDFRTWLGTLRAFEHLRACAAPADEAEADAEALAAVDAVAELLRNTRDVARDSYVHPVLLEMYRAGALHRDCALSSATADEDEFTTAEAELLALLEDAPIVQSEPA